MDRTYARETCPHCDTPFDPLPKAKKRCPACGRTVWVRSGPDGRRYILREEELTAHEDGWASYHERRAWIAQAEPFIDERGFEAIERDLATKDPGYTPRDVYWVAANRAIVTIIASGDWQTINEAYFRMARAAHEEADEPEVMTDRSVLLMREANRAQLRARVRSEFGNRVEIFAESCQRCQRDDRMQLDPRRELDAPRIPHADCENGWCTCEYVVSVQ